MGTSECSSPAELGSASASHSNPFASHVHAIPLLFFTTQFLYGAWQRRCAALNAMPLQCGGSLFPCRAPPRSAVPLLIIAKLSQGRASLSNSEAKQCRSRAHVCFAEAAVRYAMPTRRVPMQFPCHAKHNSATQSPGCTSLNCAIAILRNSSAFHSASLPLPRPCLLFICFAVRFQSTAAQCSADRRITFALCLPAAPRHRLALPF